MSKRSNRTMSSQHGSHTATLDLGLYPYLHAEQTIPFFLWSSPSDSQTLMMQKSESLGRLPAQSFDTTPPLPTEQNGGEAKEKEKEEDIHDQSDDRNGGQDGSEPPDDYNGGSAQPDDTFDPEERVSAEEDTTFMELASQDLVDWKALGACVIAPGAAGGIGRWMRSQMNEIEQPIILNVSLKQPISLTFSPFLIYNASLGAIAALMGCFVLAKVLLNIQKNKLTYLGLSLIFGMFSSSVFAIGSQTVLSNTQDQLKAAQNTGIGSNDNNVQEKALQSSQAIALDSSDNDVKEDAIEVNQAIALTSNASEVKQQAIETSQVIALGSDASEVQQQAIETSRAIATSSDAQEVQKQAIETSRAIAIGSNDPDVEEEAIEASQEIAISNDPKPDVQQEAIQASQAIATNSEDSGVKEEAIQASQAIATNSEDSEIKEEAIQASQAIATSQNANSDVQQEAIQASQAIAVSSNDPIVQEKAIDTTVTIFRDVDTTETATQIAAVQAIGEVAMDIPISEPESKNVREHALEQLRQLRTMESLDQSVIETIDQVETDLQ